MSRSRRCLASLVAVCAVALVSCGDDDTDEPIPTSDASTSTSGGDTSTTTDTEPGGEDPAVSLQPIVEISGAAGIADPEGPGPVLLATRDGAVLSLDIDDGSSELVLDLGDAISTGGERGLLDIALTPDGSRLVANMTNTSGDTEIRSWPMTDGRPVGDADDGVLHLEIEQPQANHNGGNLEFGPDGMLWIGTGDGGGAGDPEDRAQNPDELLGKMLRVDLDPAGGVGIPADNPSAGAPEVWAVGLRNPWRYSFDPTTGRLWIADVGQNEVEEVTVVDPADFTGSDVLANFGWNRLEGDQPFSGPAPDDAISPGFTYRHDETGGCSITGGHVYRGSLVESLVGWYVFGDYCGGWLWAVPADSPDSGPVELANGVGQVTSIEVLDDGELVLLTEDHIFALTPR